LSPSDRFILDEVIRHNRSTQTSPLSPPELSQPIVSDGYHYKQINLHKCPKSVKPFLSYVDRDFRDTSARTQFRITGVYLVTPTDTTLDPTYCYRYYDLRAYPHAPTCLDDYEHEPCHQVLDDANYIFVPPVSAVQRRANKVHTVATRGVTDKAMTYMQAMAHPEAPGLKAALIDELKSLSPSEHNTWVQFLGSEKDIPKGRLISSKAIFSIVYNPDGSFKKYKARLVARGDMLKSKSKDTYSGTVSSQATRLLLGIIAEHDLDLRSFDVKTAFLYTRLNEFSEGIYMRRPKGFSDAEMPAIVRLLGGLYGLDIASKLFEEHFSKTLTTMGFKRLISDPQVFRLDKDGDFCLLSTFVDDALAAASPGSSLLDFVEKQLELTYKITIQKDPHTHLGLKITRDRACKSLTASQPQYVADMLTRFQVNTSGPFPLTPMSETHISNMYKYTHLAQLPDFDQTLYMEKVGCLIHLATQSRPDLIFSVTQLSRRNKKATRRDMSAVDRTLRYVAGTPTVGQTYCTYGLPPELYATVDVSYNCHADSKSHTGVSLHYGRFSTPFISMSKKQSIIADSSTAAEFIGAHTGAQAIMWARNFLEELGFQQKGATCMYQDNMSTIRLIGHKGNTGRMKHIALRYDFVREQVRLGTIRIEHLHTTKMTADTLTKPLGPSLFAQHAIRLLNTSPPDPDDLEAYRLSLCSIAKSAQRINIIRLSNAHLPLRAAKLLRRRVRWSL
jgi:hypothetical protein